MKAIAKEAYKAGALDVIAHYVDEDITRLRYEHNDVDYFKKVPDYLVELRNKYALEHLCCSDYYIRKSMVLKVLIL